MCLCCSCQPDCVIRPTSKTLEARAECSPLAAAPPTHSFSTAGSWGCIAEVANFALGPILLAGNRDSW